MKMNNVKKEKIFISGPMTGYADFNKKAFYDAETLLTASGWSVFNPAWIAVDETWDRNSLLPIDIIALSQCSAIYMLTGWEQSAGARAEYEYAVSCGKRVIYQSTIGRSPDIIITDTMIKNRYGNKKSVIAAMAGSMTASTTSCNESTDDNTDDVDSVSVDATFSPINDAHNPYKITPDPIVARGPMPQVVTTELKYMGEETEGTGNLVRINKKDGNV